jgi:hypothetical protein
MSKCEISLEKGWNFECFQRMLKDFVNLKCEILDFQQREDIPGTVLKCHT